MDSFKAAIEAFSDYRTGFDRVCEDLRTQAEQRIVALEDQNTIFRRNIKELELQIHELDNAGLHEDDIDFDKNLIGKAKKRDPENVIQTFVSTPDSIEFRHYTKLSELCHELYHDNLTLATSFCKVRRRLKSSQHKIKEWNALFEQERFEVSLNGEMAQFRRLNNYDTPMGTRIDNRRPPLPDSPALPPIPRTTSRPSQPSPNKSFNETHSHLHDSEFASTQSQDPRYEAVQAPCPLLRSSSDSPVFVSEKPVWHRRTKRDRRKTDKDNGTNDNEEKVRPVRVKSEQPPDSPILCLTSEKLELFPGIDDSASLQNNKENIGTPVRTVQARPSTKHGRGVLQSVDTNVTPCHQTTKDPFERRSKRRKLGGSGEKAIPSVAEDGESHSYNTKRRPPWSRKSTGKNNCDTPASGGRQTVLQSLLEMEQTPRPVLASPGLLGTEASRNFRTNSAATESVTSHNLQKNDNTDNALPQSPAVGDGMRPKATPFRDLPIEELCLDHFKINPKKNQGLDYAFVEVVRDKNMRKQLSGCLDQRCCGPIFRNMAREEIGDAPRLRFTLSAEYSELLKNDLDERTYKYLENYSGLEIRDLLVEAKARVLSNKYSKHRAAHGRPRSPPGYWRTEMPSTQEAELDREIASRHKQKKVLERYKEACKGSGLWIFADE